MKLRVVRQYSRHKGDSTRLWFGLLAIFCSSLGLGCAQVPRQSVTLSTTIGRDVAQVHRAHRELAIILYERIKNDVNRFVDEVYTPYQTKKLLLADHEDFKKGDPDSLYSVLDVAIKQPDNPEAQKTVLQAMDVFLQVVRAEVEAYRSERLAPILAQEKEVLSAIDRSYSQIHYANSIVTGHLASILEVHDAQEDLLNEFGIQGLRQDIGQRLSATSSSIAEFVMNAKRLEGTMEEIEKNMEELTRELDTLVGRKETR